MSETPDKAVYNHVPWYFALREDGWKYIRYLTPGVSEELYDLSHDPEELTNLAGRAQHSERMQTMRRRAVAELQRTDAGYADRLPSPQARP